ncbi:MAG: AAA family ATPase [Anaerolineales bacterium]|jgi:pilus assembly protein CpaE
MNPANKQIRVVALCDPGTSQQQITEALNSQNEFILVDILTSKEMLARQIRAAEPDILLVDSQLQGESTMDIIDDLALQFPTASVVAILPTNDPLVAQQVMLAGARGFLITPFSQINLVSTLRRVSELEGRRQQTQAYVPSQVQEATRPLRSVTVYSPRGGTGVTSIAVNTAIALAEETSKRVLLFEGKVFFGHLEVMLNLKMQNALSDLIPHATNLDEGLIRDVVSPHPSGIHVLLAPSNVQVAQGIRAEDIYNIFIGVSRYYDYIVVDAGGPLNDISVTLMDATDRILLVTTPDLASLHDTSRFLQLSRSLSYPADKILMILNKAGVEGGVKLKDIEAVLHNQVYHQIANDPANVLRSINRGIPFLVFYPRSSASKSIQQLARNLTSISLRDVGRESVPAAGEKAGRDMLLASSRLG